MPKRRTLIAGTAWAVPGVLVSATAPAFAASGGTNTSTVCDFTRYASGAYAFTASFGEIPLDCTETLGIRIYYPLGFDDGTSPGVRFSATFWGGGMTGVESNGLKGTGTNSAGQTVITREIVASINYANFERSNCQTEISAVVDTSAVPESVLAQVEVELFSFPSASDNIQCNSQAWSTRLLLNSRNAGASSPVTLLSTSNAAGFPNVIYA